MKNSGRGLVFLAVLAMALAAGCHSDWGHIRGDGNIESREISARGFDSVTLSGAGNVRIRPGAYYRVVVTTDSNIQDIVTISVNGASLDIGMRARRGATISPTRVDIDVYLPELRGISLDGAGNFTVGSGETPSLEISVRGAGNVYAQDFQAQIVDVRILGVGNVEVWATDTLNGVISGVGSLLYKGNPRLRLDTGVLGRVRQL